VGVRWVRAKDADPAEGAFLQLLRKDIAAGRNLHDLPPDIVAVMRTALKDARVDLDEPIEGKVGL
jgi:antitoxin PrlF